jgi:hypothetical protein
MGAAEASSIRLQPMPDDSAPAMLAARREGMDRALKAVKHMPLAPHRHLKALVIFISANFASCHGNSPELSLD